METLKDFMLLFRVEPGNRQPTQEELGAMQQQWGAFIGGIAAQARLISTSRLGFEGATIGQSLAVQSGVYTAGNQTLSGNMVVKATTLQEAAELAKGCPVLQMGGSVEVRDIIPMQS